MAQPYVGEIRLFAGNFPPNGWMFCDGTPLSISENTTLFQLIGTTYGGDGQTTFNLPNLQSRIPMHAGTGSSGTTYQLGESGGVESVTLTTQQQLVSALARNTSFHRWNVASSVARGMRTAIAPWAPSRCVPSGRFVSEQSCTPIGRPYASVTWGGSSPAS